MTEEQGSSAWELSKENVVPMRSGRKKAALAEISDPSDSTSKHALEQKRRELRQAIQDYTGDDPLENWVRLVKWTQEHLTGGKAELQKILEACTSALLKFERYTNDIRFLRIWIQYADCLPDPNDVFMFLKEKQIGMEFALFFEAYATYYELRGNCSAADAVYQDGINRGARPLERLKQKYSAFQTRMAARIQRKIQDESINGQAAEEPQRASLAPMVPVASRLGAASTSLMPAPARLTAPAAAAAPLLGVSRPAAPSSLLLGPQQQQQQQARAPGLLAAGLMQQRPAGPAAPIPVDEEFQGGAPRGGLLLPGYSTMPQGVNNLRELKPYGVVRKENNEKPAAWAGSTLAPQAAPGQYAPAAPAKLEICVDDEFQEDEPAQSSAPAPAPPSFRQLVDTRAQPAAVAPAAAFSLLPGAPAPAAAVPAPLAGSKLLGGLLGGGGLGAGSSAVGAPPVGGVLGGALGGQPRPGLMLQPSLVPGSLLAPQTAAAGALTGAQHASKPHAALAAPAAALQGSGAAPAAKKAAPSGPCFAPVGYDASLLQGSKGEEMSFEEVRAARWLQRNPLPSNVSTAPASSSAPVTQPAPIKPAPTGALAPRPALGALSTSAALPLSTAVQPQPAAAPRKAFASLRGPTTSGSGPVFGGQTDMQAQQPGPSVSRSTPALVPASIAAPPATGFAAAPGVPPAPASTQPAKPDAPARRAFSVIPAPDTSTSAPAAPETAPAAAATKSAAPVSLVGMIPEDDDFFAGPELHLPGPSSSHHMTEPTVTMSTRAAFAALNDMFGDGGSGVAAAVAGSGPSQAAARAGSSSLSVGMSAGGAQPLGRQAAQPLMEAPAPKRMHHEPTVTINTRLAFDAMNDMFSDSQPAETYARGSEEEDMAKMPTLPAAMKPISAIDVCRLANSSKAVGSVMPAAPLAIHEDTEYIRPDLMGPGNSRRGRRSSVGLPGLFPANSSAFAIHEDTQLLPAANQSGLGSSRANSLNIYEDTVCVGMMPLPAAGAVAPAAAAVAASRPPAGGLYEDTEFITAPAARALTSFNASSFPAAPALGGQKFGLAPRPAAGWQGGGKEN